MSRSPSLLQRESVDDGVIAGLANALDDFDKPLDAREWCVLAAVLADLLRDKTLDVFAPISHWEAHPLLVPHGFTKREIVRALGRLHETGCLHYVPGRGKRVSYVSLRPMALAHPVLIESRLEV